MLASENCEIVGVVLETYIESLIEKVSIEEINPSKPPAGKIIELVKATPDEKLVEETLYGV